LKTRIAVSFAIAIVFSLILHASEQGFSGKWVLDRGSPRPGDAPNNLEMKIKQSGTGLSFETTFQEPKNGIVPLLYLGIMTTNLKLSTNGETIQNQVGPFQMASKTTMTSDRQMDTDWKGVVNGDAVDGHWTHKLADDGKHMTLEIKESSTQGHNGQATLYLVRK